MTTDDVNPRDNVTRALYTIVCDPGTKKRIACSAKPTRSNWSLTVFFPRRNADWRAHNMMHRWRTPKNTGRWPSAGVMLGHRLRRWPNIIPALGLRGLSFAVIWSGTKCTISYHYVRTVTSSQITFMFDLQVVNVLNLSYFPFLCIILL